MESISGHDSKQATIDEIKGYDVNELLGWVEKNLPNALTRKQRDKFKDADINGTTFLEHAGDRKFFHEGCKLPIGTSERLAKLAAEIAPIKSKFTIFIHAHYVNCKLTALQKTDNRPEM